MVLVEVSSSDALVLLIRSLDANEKRLVSRYAGKNQRKGQHQLLHLFEFLQQDPLSPIQFKPKEGILHKDLPSAKYKLRKLIFRALRQGAKGSEPNEKASEMLFEIEFLFRKKLFRQSARLIEKALKFTQKHHLYQHQLAALDWEAKNMGQLKHHNLPGLLDKNTRHRLLALQNLQEEITLLGIFRQAHGLTRMNTAARPWSEIPEFAEVLEESLLLAEEEPESPLAKISKQLVLGMKAFAEKDFPQAQERLSHAERQLEAFPHLVKQYPEMLRIAVVNLLNTCLYQSQPEDFVTLADRFRKLEMGTPVDQARLKQLVLATDLLFCLNFGEQERGKQLVDELTTWIAQNENDFSPLILFNLLYNSTQLFFLYGDFRNALIPLNQILSLKRTDLRKDIYDFAHLFQLVVHFELGNLDLLEHLIRNVGRYFRLRETEIMLHIPVLSTLKKYIKTVSPKEKEAVWENLYAELMKIKKQKAGAVPLGWQELVFWVESKREGVLLGDWFMEKLKSR